eukprot:CAMPEP_0119300346 /NCGR_PEP_ID=MMETSP1333-20130426/2290_1 /TAXON_ID=418940 /ORGANISM="Scyphosphaera apsteinii, Strain RCC1455" /LENGTH=278 /DNA_ID=CAMNT_0007302073 /DNA_START=51 /DNA_END=887 /DNA_ORIENTATION=-
MAGVSATCATGKRSPPEPPAPDMRTVKVLAKRWTEQEEQQDYKPTTGKWPPQKFLLGDIPGLRSDPKRCGGLGRGECDRVAFRLAVAYLGGSLVGHQEDGGRATHELAQGAEIMRTLAERGSPEGACGWAFCLANGEGVAEDIVSAVQYHQQAAAAGCAQSMHELGIMHYLGEGVPADGEIAVHWFREAAIRGVIASMYLLGECLLEGEGTKQNTAAAFGWFAAAGDMGHRSARARVLSAYLAPDTEGRLGVDEWNESMRSRYFSAAALRPSQWTMDG